MMRIKIYIVFFTIVVLSYNSCSNRTTTKDPGYEFAPNMYESLPKDDFQSNNVFDGGLTAQLPPEGTVPLGFEKYELENTLEDYEKAGRTLTNPLDTTELNFDEGKALYLSMCSQCHGKKGNGDGALVKLDKFPPPPSYSTGNSSRGGAMNELSEGKIYHTIVHGVNLMGPHASQLSPKERWQIVMYIKKELQK